MVKTGIHTSQTDMVLVNYKDAKTGKAYNAFPVFVHLIIAAYLGLVFLICFHYNVYSVRKIYKRG